MTAGVCFELCKAVFLTKGCPSDLREAALRSLGSVMLSNPEMLHNQACQPILTASLSLEASPALKRAALTIVLDLLNADEEKLGEEQKHKEEGQKKGKKQGKAKRKSEPVPVVNGEQDTISITSSIVQVVILIR